MNLVDVRDLRVSYPRGERPVLDGVSFGIGRGESVGMIGESGSGKTQTALAIMGLLPPNAAAEGSVRFEDVELLGAGAATLNRYRPCRMAMVFQDPSGALNPYLTIGDQLGRIVREHRLAAGRDVAARVLDMLRRVGLPDPNRQLFAYPHQLSGGMRQRVMIAAALIGDPDLLIADEPTTALDVTVQAQILELLRTLREELASALLLISHDLGVIAGNCSRMLVLDGGRLIEQGASRELFVNPRQARTRAMLAAVPALWNVVLADDAGVDEDDVCLAARGIRVSHFERPFGAVWRRDEVERVRDVRLHLARGETLALVGESGSGKTSLARALLGLEPPRRGEITLLGEPLAPALERRPATLRRKLQLVFQDPAGSLNPAMRVADIVAEPLLIAAGAAAAERRAAVAGMLMRVGLAPELAARYPHQLSGGQAQRVAIARALITQPAVLVCDEALAALDAPVRHDILELLRHEQAARGLSILFISHDLGVVKGLAHRVMVMYMGRICEVADSATLFARPRHPYTRALLDSVPVPDPRAGVLPAEVRGEVGSLREPPSGCVFHPRCRFAVDRCRVVVPALFGDGASAACHRAQELDLSLGQPLPVWK